MKRIFSTLCLALLSLTALADEGMWLPSLISSRIDDMRAKGFQLTAEDIYSINKASLKDAVMLFDDGCTAELISPEGLLITNHHCGYGAIQRLSSVEHDYLTDGFWAQSREEELPNENLNVKFLKRMEDITERLAAGESREEILEKAPRNLQSLDIHTAFTDKRARHGAVKRAIRPQNLAQLRSLGSLAIPFAVRQNANLAEQSNLRSGDQTASAQPAIRIKSLKLSKCLIERRVHDAPDSLSAQNNR